MLPECGNCGATMRLRDESVPPFRYRCANCHSRRAEDGDSPER